MFSSAVNVHGCRLQKNLEGRIIELIVSVEISDGESTAGVLVDDAFKGCHYGLERPGSTVLGSKEINALRFRMEEYIISLTKKKYIDRDIFN